jgi:predicted Fe-Mo cluster-binding NifX family protein
MKIVFSATGKDWNAQLDERFGRAKGFVFFDEATKNLTWHSNEENMNAAHGAGTQAAQFVINTGASSVISGEMGPKAFDILNRAGIKIFNSKIDTLEKVYNAYKQGKLKQQIK